MASIFLLSYLSSVNFNKYFCNRSPIYIYIACFVSSKTSRLNERIPYRSNIVLKWYYIMLLFLAYFFFFIIFNVYVYNTYDYYNYYYYITIRRPQEIKCNERKIKWKRNVAMLLLNGTHKSEVKVKSWVLRRVCCIIIVVILFRVKHIIYIYVCIEILNKTGTIVKNKSGW